MIVLKKGNFGKPLTLTIKEGSGVMDLTGLSATLKVWSGTALLLSRGLTVNSPQTQGKVTFTPLNTDFTGVGTFLAEIALTGPSVEWDTKTFTISVLETAP